MAVPNEASIVIHKTISKEDASAYYARRTSEALDLLFGDASVSNLPGPRVIDSIKKWKNAVVEPESKWDIFSWKYATPVWNIIATDMKKLELIGLTQEEVETLGPILPAKTPSGAHPTEREKLKSELVPQILFVLKVLDYDEANFQNFVKISISRYPAVGIMICEILCDDKILAKARPFLVEESFDKKRHLLLQFLKKDLRNCQLLSIIHMVASCGDQIENIAPDEMSFYFNDETFSPWDMAAMAKVTSFSSLIKMHFYRCNLNDESIVVLQDELSKSNVKIDLGFIHKPGIDVKGWSCVGELVKDRQIKNLTFIACELTFEQLDAFNKSSGDFKIHNLNISGNPNIDVKGWSCVGELVKNHKVEQLNLNRCELTYDKLDVFNKSSGDFIIHNLNISGNPNIDVKGWSCVGELVKNHKVEQLNLNRCELTYDKLDAFNKSSGDFKIRTLHIRDNRIIGERGFEILGYIVKRHDIDRLEIGETYYYGKMSNIYNEITLFCAALGDKEINYVKWTFPRKNVHWINIFELGQRLMAACELSLKVANDLRLRNNFGDDCNFSPDKACEAAILLQDFINVHHRQNLILKFEYDCYRNTPPIHAGESCEVYMKRLEQWRLEVKDQIEENFWSSSSLRSSSDKFESEKCSQLFEVHEGRIKLEPFETRMQIYQARYPNLKWSSKKGEDLLEKRFPLGSKSLELSKSDSDLARSSEPQSTSKELWGTSSNKHSTSEGSAAGPKWRDSESHIDEDKQCSSKDWGSVSSESHTANIKPSKPSTQASSPITNVHVKVDVHDDHRKSELAGIKTCFESPTHIKELEEGSESDHASKYIFPTETTVITVGNGAEIVHVGGCVVEFQAGSFSEPQEITVTAEINPGHWPPGREAITPTLSISAKNLLKEATVKLHTWSCNGEDEEDNAEVWRYTKKENKWDVIKSCSTGESNFIEFKVSHFCSFLAILKEYFISRNIIRPIVCHRIRNFVVALIKDTPLIRKHFDREMEITIGMGMQQKILAPIKCKKSDKIKTVILSVPQEGFKFECEDTFLHPIQEVFGEASESYHCVALTSHLPAQYICVVIEFLKDDGKLRADTFSHYWDPGVTSHSKGESKPPEEEELSPMRSTPPPTNSGESAISESQPKPNIVVHGDATFSGNNLGSGHVIQGTTAGMINEGTCRIEEHGTTHSIASTSRTT